MIVPEQTPLSPTVDASAPSSTTLTNDQSQPKPVLHPSTGTGKIESISPAPQIDVISFVDSVTERLVDTCMLDAVTGQTTFVGKTSTANYFRNIAALHGEQWLPDDISVESAFLLTNRTTLHPFGSLWTTINVTLFHILQSLGPAEDCMGYYRKYQHIIQPIYPFLLDPLAFEQRFGDLLQYFGESGIDASLEHILRQSTFGDAAWYGLLFAVLASGCQFSTELSDRILRTRVLVVCAFECLRLANLYVQPSVEVIQCLLLLEITIANDSNPGVALGLLGLTIQQAQSLGLHLKQTDLSSSSSGTDGVHPLWRNIIAMESTLSTAFDRRPTSFLPLSVNVICNSTSPDGCPFIENMHALHSLRLDWQLTLSKDRQSSIGANMVHAALITIDNAADAAMQDPNRSSSMQGRVENLIYTIHASSFKAQLLRYNTSTTESMRARRIGNFEAMREELTKVVQAFVALKPLSPVALIAWDILHLVLSAGLVLAALDKAFGTTEARETLRKLRRAFPSCHGKVLEEEREMAVASFYHGLETLEWFIGG